MNADKAELAEAYDRLESAAGPLMDVTRRKMFGCEALFATGNIFALVWRDGRLGVRLPDATIYGAALARAGATPWAVSADAKPMAHWVLLPEADHEDPAMLAGWVARAHALAMALGPKPTKSAP